MNDIARMKQELRKSLSDKRKAISQHLRQHFSSTIQKYVLQYLQNKQPGNMLTYKALSSEVNTDMLISSPDYQVYVPRMLPENNMEWVSVNEKTNWQSSDFQVLEPEMGELWQPSDNKSVLFCPLLGFDKQGYRLGMGKGYFDRWLEKFGQDVDVVGLGFSCQELARVPIEPHDVPLSTIITEQGILHVE
ncbi:MAG: 5-formyltetrahydrofolate cyclo-ligase [Ghiorsea sp.]